MKAHLVSSIPEPKMRIVHESEAQRQFVRTPLAARVVIDGKTYHVRDLSPGGIGITGVEGSFIRTNPVALRLELPFEAFSMDIDCTGEVQHFDKQTKLLGLRFTDLTPAQISLLNYVIKAFMAGQMLPGNDVIDIVSRNNFVKMRGPSASEDTENTSRLNLKRQLPGLALIGILGIAALWFVLSNVYSHLFVIKSTDAVVASPTYEIRAIENGVYSTLLNPVNATTVRPGQDLAAIRFGRDRVIFRSPCDCFVAKRYDIQDGQYVNAGTSLISLIANDARPWVNAAVAPQEAAKLEIDGDATVTVSGVDIAYTGRIADIESGLANPAPGAGEIPYMKPTMVKVILDQKIPVDLVNRPAQVKFAAR